MKKSKYEVGEEIFVDPSYFYNNIAPLTTSDSLFKEYEKELQNKFNIEIKEKK